MPFCTASFLARAWREIAARAVFVALGALLLLVPILLMNYLILDVEVHSLFVGFAGSIVAGSYAEGIVFPFLYFEAAEGALAFVWALGIILAFVILYRRRSATDFRLRLWLIGLVTLYLLMALLSTGLQVFVLYGRTARELAPLIALVCGASFAYWFRQRDYRGFLPALAIIAALAFANLWHSINLEYFRGIIEEVTTEYGPVRYVGPLKPPPPERGEFQFPENAESPLALVNAGKFKLDARVRRALPEGAVLLKDPASYLMYRPLQFEGLTPERRANIDREGLYIWLIDTGSPGRVI